MKLARTGKQTDANKALDNHAVITHRHALSALADNCKTENIRYTHTHTSTQTQKSGGKRERESALHSEERRVMKREKGCKEKNLNHYHFILKISFMFVRCWCLELWCVEVDWYFTDCNLRVSSWVWKTDEHRHLIMLTHTCLTRRRYIEVNMTAFANNLTSAMWRNVKETYWMRKIWWLALEGVRQFKRSHKKRLGEQY